MPEEGRTIRGGGHWVTKCVSKHGENGPAWKEWPRRGRFPGLRTGSLGIREISSRITGVRGEGLRRIKEEGGRIGWSS